MREKTLIFGTVLVLVSALIGLPVSSAGAATYVDVHATLSWEVWQDFNNNGGRDTGEVWDQSGIEVKVDCGPNHWVKQSCGGYAETQFPWENWYPISGLNETHTFAGGTANGNLHLVGDGATPSLTFSAHSEVVGGLAGADQEGMDSQGGVLVYPLYGFTQPFPTYLTLTLDDYDIAPVVDATPGAYGWGQVSVSCEVQTYYTDGVSTWQEANFEQNLFYTSDIGGGSAIALLQEFEVWPLESTSDPNATPLESFVLLNCSVGAYAGADGTGECIPEPCTLALLSLAACGLGGYVRMRRKA